MKNTSKFISLALALVLLISSAFTVLSTAAEGESEQVDILAQNVLYNDKVSVTYAVDVAVDDALSVKVSYYYESAPAVLYEAALLDTSNPQYLYTVTDDNGTPDDDTDDATVSYPTFATEGFAPHNFTDVIYAVAYVGDSVPENATYKRYSVAEYLYAQLYKNGFDGKTEADGDDYLRKVHYENMLAYSASAQTLFDKEETSIDAYTYVYFANGDGTVNGAACGLYENSAELTVSYTGANEAIKGWSVNDGKSYVVGKTDAKVTAEGEYMCLKALEKVPNIILNPNNAVGTTIDVVKDPAEGGTKENVMLIQDPGTSALDGTNWATVGMDVVDASSNVYVFESDVFIPAGQGNGQELISFSFMAADGSIVSRFFIGVNGDILRIKENNSSVSGNQIVATAQTKGDWFTFKIVLTNGATPTVAISIDGVAIEDTNGYLNSYYTANAGKDVANYFQIGFMNQLAVDAYFDNVSYTQGVAAAE